MSKPANQVLLTSMVFVIAGGLLFGAPLIPTVVGVLGGGVFGYLRLRFLELLRERRSGLSGTQAQRRPTRRIGHTPQEGGSPTRDFVSGRAG